MGGWASVGLTALAWLRIEEVRRSILGQRPAAYLPLWGGFSTLVDPDPAQICLMSLGIDSQSDVSMRDCCRHVADAEDLPLFKSQLLVEELCLFGELTDGSLRGAKLALRS